MTTFPSVKTKRTSLFEVVHPGLISDDDRAEHDFADGARKVVAVSHRAPPVLLAGEASGQFGRQLHGALGSSSSLVKCEQPFVGVHGCDLGRSRCQRFPLHSAT